MRRRIGQASLENCSVIESMLSECIRNGSFTEKRVRGCDWLREQFYSCLTEQRVSDVYRGLHKLKKHLECLNGAWICYPG